MRKIEVKTICDLDEYGDRFLQTQIKIFRECETKTFYLTPEEERGLVFALDDHLHSLDVEL